MFDHKKREHPGVWFENPSESGRARSLAQAKGSYILKQAMVLVQVCRHRQQLHHGLFDLVTVSPFHSHRVTLVFAQSQHWVSGSLFFLTGALHRQWCCIGSIARSLEQAIITLVDKIPYGTIISGLLLPCRRTLGSESFFMLCYLLYICVLSCRPTLSTVFVYSILMYKNVLLDLYVHSMLYAYTSKEVYIFIDALQSAVFRCAIAVAAATAAPRLLLLSPVLCACTVMIALVVVIT